MADPNDTPEGAAAESSPPDSGPRSLVSRLSLLPREQRSGAAITDEDIAAAALLDAAHFTDLCEQLKAAGVVLRSFRERVDGVRAKAKADAARSRLHVVPNPPPDPRPTISIDNDRIHEAVRSGVIAVSQIPNVYQRDGVLCYVVGAPEATGHDRAPQALGTPTIRTMTAPTLWEKASEAARWMKFDPRAGGMVSTQPVPAVIAAMLSRGNYPDVRELAGILENAALRPDGSIVYQPGYDEPTGFLCAPSDDFWPPVERPSQADACMALAELCEPFCDFPYADEPARMVPIAAILTLFARPAILGAIPGIFFDASTRGSGKTLQADAVSLIATGRTPPPMSWPNDDTELDKILGAYALRGPQVILFDNVTGDFGGGPLDRVLTAQDKVPMRVLGKSELPEMAWRTLVLASGCNLSLRGDTARRLLVTRLEPKEENPEDRAESTFKHPDLLAWIRANRPRLVRAALTILRAFVVAERPRMGCKAWGRFEQWSALIAPAIVYAGGADPMLARPTVTGEEEPEKAALACILEHLPRLDVDGKGMSAREIVGDLYPPDSRHGAPPDPTFDDLREAIEQLAPARGSTPDPTRLGKALGKMRKRWVNGRRLAYTKVHGTRKWHVEAQA